MGLWENQKSISNINAATIYEFAAELTPIKIYKYM